MQSGTQYKIGDKIQNRWEIYKILRGGMGIVYIVYDHQLHMPLAAKTFQDEIFIRNPAIADRFTQEALTWIKLDVHLNVTRVHLVQKIAGKPFLLLEYIGGGDLSEWIGTPRLTENLPQVLHFAMQFCDGMTHALSKGIQAHRDIKPQNCLITSDKVLKLTDFGLAKVFDDSESELIAVPLPNAQALSIHLTRTGAAAGTPTHMAPEQFDDAKHIDVRADIYSFGVMLFQMITGRLPFEGQKWQEFEHLHKTAPLPTLETDHYQLSEVIHSCLAKDPACRFADFNILRQRLAETYKKLTGKDAPCQVTGKELNAWDWNNKGSSLHEMGRREIALTCFDTALALNTSFEQAWYNKGLTLYELSRFEEAIACCDRAIDINPSSDVALSNKGVALWSLGRNEESLACYERAIQLNPYDEQAWVNKGISFKTLGRNDEARICFDHGLRLNHNSDLAWFNKGGLLEAIGQYDEAIVAYDKALKLNPRLEHAWHNKGKILAEVKRCQEAVSCFDRTIELDPNYVLAWINKGTALKAIGRFDEALNCFNHVSELDPKDVRNLTNKGNLLCTLGQFNDALACYNRSLELDPKSTESWFNKGTLLFTLREYDQAIICFDLVLAINPQDEQALVNKSAVLQLQQRYKDSLDCCENAIKINYRSHQAWNNKGFALYNLQEFSEALACFEESQRLGSTQAALAITMCRKMLEQSGKL